MTQANNIAVTLGWLAGSYKIANAEEMIVKSLKAQVKDLPKDGVLDLWYDMTNRKAKLNAGDWCSGAEIDAWKTALIEHAAVDTAADIEIMDEAGGPGDGDWVKIASAVGTDIRDSAISGKGLFATRSFSIGDVLVTDFMQKQNTDDPRTRWEQSDACRYTNHSDKPNAFIRKLGETVELVADETIQPNEEITCNYRDASKTLGKAFFYTYRGKPYGNEPSAAAFMQKAAATKPDTFYGLPTFLKQAQTTDDILDRIANARAQTATEVSDGNAAAGNYRKGRFNYHGLRISIENPKGSIRSGVSASGTKWSNEMKFDYGYIRGTIGADGDPVDVFIGDDPKSELVFIVNQVNKNGSFDEHKVVLGVMDAKQARQTYLANYKPGWTGAGSVVGMTMPQFKEWLTGDVTKPATEVKRAAVSTLAPWQTALGGAVAGGGLGGLADYMTGKDNILDGVLLGAAAGGTAGYAGNSVINTVGRDVGLLTPPVPTAALPEYVPDGYMAGAVENAKKYRQENQSIPYRQQIDDATLNRRVPVTPLDPKIVEQFNKAVSGDPNISIGGYYNPNTDTISDARGLQGKSLPHELTHASQPRSIPRVANTADSRLQALTHNVIRNPSVMTSFGGDNNPATVRDEIEAYLADIKRNYFAGTGKHVLTADDADAAIKWRAAELQKLRKADPNIRPPIMDVLLKQLTDQVTDQKELPPRMVQWLEQLLEIMPGLVQTPRQSPVKQAASQLDPIAALYAAAETAAWRHVPAQVGKLLKSAAAIKQQVQKAMETLSVADPGYGYVYWHPKRNHLWAVLSDSDEQENHDAWWTALSKVPGINKVITEAEFGPHGEHKDEWIQIKKARVFTKNSTINPFTLAGKPFGGPNAVTNGVVGALIGGGLGYGGGRLAEMLLPERHFERGRLSKNLALAGAVLGGTPGLVQGVTHMGMNRDAGDPSAYRSWLQPTNAQKVAPNSTAWRKHVLGKMAGADPTPTQAAILRRSAKCAMATMSGLGNPGMRPINVDAFNNVIWHDPYSPPAVNAAAAGIVSGIQQHYGGASVLTPRHFIKGLAAAGVDAATATVAGGVLGVLGGLKPESQQTLQQMGLWSGLMRGSIGSIFGQ